MKIWIDSDGGVDDALAVAMAAGLDGVEVAGISAVFGNVALDRACGALGLLAALAGLRVPVVAGAAAARDGRAPDATEVHGADGLWGATAEHAIPDVSLRGVGPVAAFLGEEGALLGIGPATNIAAALETADERRASIALMTGAYRTPGNVTPNAEFNAHCDALALAKVVEAGVKPILVGLDVCEKVALTPDDLAFFDAHADSALGRLLRQALAGYIGYYRDKGAAGSPPHDAIALAAVAAPALFTFEEAHVEIATEGAERGATRLGSGPATAVIAVDIDAAAFRDAFFGALAKAFAAGGPA